MEGTSRIDRQEMGLEEQAQVAHITSDAFALRSVKDANRRNLEVLVKDKPQGATREYSRPTPRKGSNLRDTCTEWLTRHPKVVGFASVALMLMVWSYFARSGTALGAVLPSPIRLMAVLWSLLINGYMNVPLWAHIQASLLRTMTGFVTGSVLGIIVGLLMGQSRIASAALAPFFAFARPIPAIAYIPMVIIWFGIGEFSKILVIFMASFLYVSINTSAGVRAVPQDLVRVAQTFGASKIQMFVCVIIPESLPFIFLGLKVGLALSWAVVVAAELVAAQRGLGYMIMDAATFFRIDAVYVGIILIGLIGFILEYVLNGLEHRYVHWSGRS